MLFRKSAADRIFVLADFSTADHSHYLNIKIKY
ncbi:MAG: hypothetical protein H6Q14_1951 [Bacteroidetes bacterium]|jgi:hypothetical protein|nr:hypothetical protein [Bacteroidota bacterium]